ncbi:MAG: hypothetical protein ACRD3O_19995, partial [Terriglobia bacterium]
STQDPIIRQAFARSGLDPAQYDHLHQHLAASFDPQDAMQALLVEDLTRLYWLKNISQRAMAEWQAREAESFHFECAKRRHQARRFEPVIEDSLVLDGRWLRAESCPEKFEKLDELLETLDSLASTADWNNAEQSESGAARRALPADGEDEEESLAEAVLYQIYGRQLTWTGKRIQRLFAHCAEEHVPADDPRVDGLRALIREERESVQEEQRLYEQEREMTIAEPLSEADVVLNPVGTLWMDMVEQETAFDRQIASKIRLLMKLQQGSAESRAFRDSAAVPDLPDQNPETPPPSPPAPLPQAREEGAPPAPSPASGGSGSGSETLPSPLGEREQGGVAGEGVNPAPAQTFTPSISNVNVENLGTNPKSMLTPVESSDAHDGARLAPTSS